MRYFAAWLGLLLALHSPPLMAAGAERFKVVDGVVRDNRTGLQWQGQIEGGSFSHSDATAYCKALSLNGGGWRLPAVKELLTLVDPVRMNPAIDERAFPGTPAAWFWSASLDVYDVATSGWKVFFFDGTSGHDQLTVRNRVRCVR